MFTIRRKPRHGSKIVIDLDNTLIDELGATLRPGIKTFLNELKKNFRLCLWTSSSRSRARSLLDEFKLTTYFSEFIFREDYDPDSRGVRKDCRRIDAKFIIDDDPAEIEFNRKKGVQGYTISTYRKGHANQDYSSEYRTVMERLL